MTGYHKDNKIISRMLAGSLQWMHRCVRGDHTQKCGDKQDAAITKNWIVQGNKQLEALLCCSYCNALLKRCMYFQRGTVTHYICATSRCQSQFWGIRHGLRSNLGVKQLDVQQTCYLHGSRGSRLQKYKQYWNFGCCASPPL